MIDKKNKFIFIQVPKTGCTSVEYTMKKTFPTTAKTLNPKKAQVKNSMRDQYKHATYKEFEFLLGEKEIKNYYIFTFVRNPFDWLVSNYFYCRGLHGCYKSDWSNSNPDLYKKRETIANELTKKDLNFNQWLMIYANEWKASQLELLTDKNGEIKADFIGKTENLETDVIKVLQKYGVNNFKVPHKNKTKKRKYNYKKYYNQESIEIVNEFYKKEMELFNYKF
jgi:hypothetical protein